MGTPYPEIWIPDRLTVLCGVLEVPRVAYGKPFHIISGYRTPVFNAALAARSSGVAKNSQHPQGRAADISLAADCYSVDPVEIAALHELVRRLYDAGEMPALGGLGLYPHWLHLDVRATTPGHLATWTGAGFGSEQ